jgi:hypothetical protein
MKPSPKQQGLAVHTVIKTCVLCYVTKIMYALESLIVIVSTM